MSICLTTVTDPDGAAEWYSVYPNYAAITMAESRRRLRVFECRLRDRMVAAKMSLAYFGQGITKHPAKLPPSMARLSVNELSKPLSPALRPRGVMEGRCRRVDNGAQVRRVAELALHRGPSVDFAGYYQRHKDAA